MDEVESTLSKLGVACSRIMTYKDMLENPHYIARGSITEWDDENLGRKVKGTNTFPYFKNNPSRIYRGGARYGADTVDVMHELGYSDDEIEKLLGENIIKA